MKKMIGLGLYGLVLMGLSAGGAWLVRSKQIEDTAAALAQAKAEEEAINPKPVLMTDPLTDPTDSSDEMLPVAVRPEAMTVEEIVQYGMGMKSREEAIRSREEALERAEFQQRLVLADIEGEQKEIEGLLVQARDQKSAAEELLKRLAAQKQAMDAERLKMEATNAAAPNPSTANPDAEANLKGITEVLQGMDPENSAKVLKEFANNGQMDTAVQMLSKLEQRNAASILDAMDDEKLVSEFLEEYYKLKRPPRTAKKR